MWEKLLVQLIPLVVNMVTPELQELLEESIVDLERKAKATKSPWDDVLIQILKEFLIQK